MTVEELKVLIVALWMDTVTNQQAEQIREIFRELNPKYDGSY